MVDCRCREYPGVWKNHIPRQTKTPIDKANVMNRQSISYLFMLLLALTISNGIRASEPVFVVMTGCVEEGLILSEKTDFGSHVQEGRYAIRPFSEDMVPTSLDVLEGERVVIEGYLLPGDSFIIKRESIRVLGPCRPLPELSDTE